MLAALASLVILGGSDVIGAAWVIPQTVANIKPEPIIEKANRLIAVLPGV